MPGPDLCKDRLSLGVVWKAVEESGLQRRQGTQVWRSIGDVREISSGEVGQMVGHRDVGFTSEISLRELSEYRRSFTMKLYEATKAPSGS